LGVFRLGVLGGTFNPIHQGHLHIARSVQDLFSLSEIRFVVATVPPHKSPENLIAFTHRYAMVSLATSGESSFVPSLVELEPQTSPYSVDTMRKISSGAGLNQGEIFFIAGGDSLHEVMTWRESESLLTSYNFVFVCRPGAEAGDFRSFLPDAVLPRIRDLTGLGEIDFRRHIEEDSLSQNRIYIVDADAPDVSATRIRSLAAEGKDFRSYVPLPVYDYIQKLRLYGGK
jgi:nicotinate-nucleotide adenylyltransferase